MTQEPGRGPDHPTPWQRANLFRSLRVVSCMCACAMARTAVCTRAVCCMHGVLSVSRVTSVGPWGAPLAALMATVGAVWSGICIKQIRKCLDPRPGLQHITTRCAVPHTWKMRATHRHGQRQRATARRGGPRAKQEGSTPLRVGHRRAQPECEPHGTVTHKGTTKLRPRHLLLDIAAHGQRAEDVGDGGGRE